MLRSSSSRDASGAGFSALSITMDPRLRSTKRGWAVSSKIMAVAFLSLAFAGVALLWPRSIQRPESLEEKIRVLEGITYDEEAPYLDARLVFRDDGIPWYCEPNNYQRLKGTTPHPRYNIWIAEVASSALMKVRDIPIITGYREHISTRFRVGDSPWGVYSLPEVRERMEPIFEDAKVEIMERLKEKERQREQAGGGEASADLH